MKRRILLSALLMAIVALAVVACAQAPASPAAPTAAPTEAKAAEPTKPAPTATPVPPTATAVPPTVTPVPPTPTAVPPTATKAPAATATPAQTGSGPSVDDLMAAIKGNTAYSFDLDIVAESSGASQEIKAKGFANETKLRMDMSISGQAMVMILDSQTGIAYLIMDVGGEKQAMKMDLKQLMSMNDQISATSPTEQLAEMIGKSRFTGPDMVDGKPAAVYEMQGTDGKGTVKYWVWIEKGVPLKVETTDPEKGGKVVVNYKNYQFGPQPDSLFELPPDVKIAEQ